MMLFILILQDWTLHLKKVREKSVMSVRAWKFTSCFFSTGCCFGATLVSWSSLKYCAVTLYSILQASRQRQMLVTGLRKRMSSTVEFFFQDFL